MSSVVPLAHARGQLSVAASRLVCFVVTVSLGLTPQAMNMPPLRGFAASPPEVLTQPRVPLLRGFTS